MELTDRGGSPSRERAVALINRQPSDTPGVEGLLTRLCRALTLDLDLSGAAVTLIPEVGSHSVAAASSLATVRVEELQFDAGEGPTREAFRTGQPVVVGDLEAEVGRWPGYAPAALKASVAAVFCFPLHVGASRLGALSLYWHSRRQPATPDLRTALVFADLATEIVIDNAIPHPGEGPDPDLFAALETHGHIYQAQGMVMVDLGVALPEALALMRAQAYAGGQALAQLASEIVAGKTVVAEDPRGPQ